MVPNNKPSMGETYSWLFRNAKLQWEKYGGKICTIAGTTGLFLTGLHASRKTYKIHDELVENGRKIQKAKAKIEGESKAKRYLRIAKTYGKVTLQTSKYYIPDILGGGVSAWANAKGWQHEHNHYKQAANMVGVLAASFMNYRKNVIAEEGIEADRKYLNTKRINGEIQKTDDKSENQSESNTTETQEGVISVQLEPSDLRIKYSRSTTPSVWSESHALRMNQLEDITDRLNRQFIHRGCISVNDIRHAFYNEKGDVPSGGMFGRIWDPGNPEHPEYGRRINLHYEDDEDFMSGIKDWCWIEIEIDAEPLFESMKIKKKKDQDNGYFSPVEPVV